MKLDDGKPWFRPFFGFGFKPITREGRLLFGGLQALVLLTGFALLMLDGRSPWSELISWLALLLFLPGLAIAYYKRDDGF